MSSPLVHSPYNAEYDLVPYRSEEAATPPPVAHHEASSPVSCGGSADGEGGFTAHHEYLSGQCEYLELSPEATLEPEATTNRLFKLFIGHVKYEITPGQLRWIVYMLTGVTCGKIETRGLGCYMAFFTNYEEMWKVKGLHKRALFDHRGVWFARNQLQEEILKHYITAYLNGTNHSHLPNGLLVVDEETSRKRHKSKGGRKPRDIYENRPQMLAPGYVPTPPVPFWWGMMMMSEAR